LEKTARGGAFEQLVREARLTDARLARDYYHPAHAARGRLKC
jgi:hypothetical protein